jgi:Ca2+-binding RTX toxin-like protein
VLLDNVGDNDADAPFGALTLDLGDGDDDVTFSIDNGIYTRTLGGKGNDIIRSDASLPATKGATDLGAGFDTLDINSLDESQFDDSTLQLYAGEGTEKVIGPLASYGGNYVLYGNDLSNELYFGATTHPVTVYGMGGDDLISHIGGGVGARLLGGSGDDRFRAGGRNDTLIGQAGIDTADYSSYNDYYFTDAESPAIATYANTDNVQLSLDGQSNDGVAGQNNNISADIENLIGGDGNDKLIGGPSANLIIGNAGRDTLYGGGGNDTLNGGGGRDLLFGQSGNDLLLARDGRSDSIDGGAGFDTAQCDKSVKINDDVLSVDRFR